MTAYKVALADSREIEANRDEMLGEGCAKPVFVKTDGRHVAQFFVAHVKKRKEGLTIAMSGHPRARRMRFTFLAPGSPSFIPWGLTS